jgi:acyl-coenzyme A synthetase/AMP-(fatty) acid ligase
MFTSGSTGETVPHRNRPGFFVLGAAGNAVSVLAGLDAPANIVATVPPFHMYGFELSIWLPLLAGATVFAGLPFYPADIVEALAAMPAPRILVSTPVHLRVLMESGVTAIDCARVFSATAPLTETLARGIEERFQCEVREIYGTTETGNVGWRRTAREDFFTLVPGMRLKTAPDGCLVSAPHIDPPIALNDRLAPDGVERFRIAGRSNDIVNIAGKRESLSGLNTVLSALDGVVDGAFLAPGDEAGGRVGRMVAFVVAPGLAAEDIRAGLRDKLDPAFIPRRIVFVESLPRNAAGKLPVSALARFAREHLDGPEPE